MVPGMGFGAAVPSATREAVFPEAEAFRTELETAMDCIAGEEAGTCDAAPGAADPAVVAPERA